MAMGRPEKSTIVRCGSIPRCRQVPTAVHGEGIAVGSRRHLLVEPGPEPGDGGAFAVMPFPRRDLRGQPVQPAPQVGGALSPRRRP